MGHNQEADLGKMYQYAHCVYYGTSVTVFGVEESRYEVTYEWVVRSTLDWRWDRR